MSDRLRANGLRSTAPRRAVLSVLEGAGSPLSHNDVVERLAEWDRATLFRNLVALADAGLVRRIDIGDRVWRYELVNHEEAQGHAHFTCTECGTVECIDGVEIRVAPPVRAMHAPGKADLTPENLEIHLRGKCTDCG